MKSFKNTVAKSMLAIIIISSTSSLFAARKPTTSTPTQEVPEVPVQVSSPKPSVNTEAGTARGRKGRASKTPSAPSMPSVGVKTYQQLINEVKNAENAWSDRGNLLSQDFVDRMIYEAVGAELDSLQFDALLQTARDYHIKTWTNQEDNIDLLKNLERQRKEALKIFAKKMALAEEQVAE